jgi:DNA (cytosine-5)-methyltransferase 1
MNVLSLFTGIGGLDLGLQRAGMTIAGQVEIDPWCRSILQKHWPEVPRHDDVRTAAEWWLSLVADTEGNRRGTRRQGRPAGNGTHRQGLPSAGLASDTPGRPAVDLVCGGFPCQPVSLAGKGLAQADSRWLWPAFADVIRQLRPAYVLVENVPGLLGRGMGDVLADLATLGYDAEWDCVPAAYVGAPHIRNRVWIVAYPQNGDGVDVPGVWGALERQPGRRITSNGGLARDLADTNGGRLKEQPERDSGPCARAGAPLRDDAVGLRDHVADADIQGLAQWESQRRNDGPQRTSPERDSWWATEPGVGRVAHGIPHRVDRLRGLGNAVVPQVAEHIGRLIMAGAA